MTPSNFVLMNNPDGDKLDLVAKVNGVSRVTTLEALQDEIHQTARNKGWWDADMQRDFAAHAALWHSEISEAFEIYRAGRRVDEIFFDENGKPEGVAVDAADLIIRILDWAGGNKIDMAFVVQLKMKYNETRAFRHGGKKL